MNPITFPGVNTMFGPPPGLDESQCMTIYGYTGVVQGGSVDGAQVVVVAWRPTSDELAAIAKGKPIFLSFLGGLPPHFVTTDFQTAIQPS